MKYLYVTLVILFFSITANADSFLKKEQIKALKEKKLLLLSITSESCPYCIKMKRDVFENKIIKKRIDKNYVYVEVLHDNPALLKKLHVKYLPMHYILSPKDLSVIDEFAGYVKPNHFLELLEEVYLQEISLFSTPLEAQKIKK